MSIARLVASLTIAVAIGGCTARTAATAGSPRPIVVQGAMAGEARALVAALAQPVEEQVQG